MRARSSLFAAALVLATLAPDAGAQPLVWKVAGPKATHFVAGSVHALRDSDYPLPAAYAEAYAATTLLVLEVGADEAEGGKARGVALAAGRLPRGRELCTELGSKDCAQAKALAAAAGLSLNKVRRYEPWLAALTLTAQGMHEHGLDAGLGVDRHLLERARGDSRPVRGLETSADQFVAFDGLSPKLQKRLLLDSLRQLPTMGADLERIVGAWRTGDLAALEQQQDEIGEAPELQHALFAARHARWLPQLEQMFAGEAPALVVVGAQHLVGKDSLLDALERAGLHPQRVD